MADERLIGIDLGTTNSCVAVIDGKDPVVIPNSEGSRTTPSYIGFSDSNERLVGQVGKRQAVTNPENTIYSMKRLMGRRYDSKEAEHQRATCPYEIVEADNGDAWVSVRGKNISPPELSAIILAEMRQVAETYLGETVNRAVVTVPAHFNDAQRQATSDAGRIAGLDVERIVNEPTAAALAYGLDKDHEGNKRIAVYDLGGGTFDISILDIEDGVFSVRSTSGDTFLGGEDFDNRLVEHLVDGFQNEHGIDLRGDKMALQRLKETSERAKHELSSSIETEINLPFIASDSSGPKHLVATIERHAFEDLVHDLVENTFKPCKQALEDAGVDVGDIDEILLVGGMTRMPLVQKTVEEFFGKKPLRGVNPDEVVAVGAAIQGAILSGDIDEVLLLDVTPLSLGVETGGRVFTRLIDRNTTIPTRKRQIFTTSVDNQNFVPIHVLQGERQMAANNKTLAKFELTGIPPAPRGIPQIQVTFDINANGIVSVAARDLGTGKEQTIRVTAATGLKEADIERIVREAESMRQDDESRKELAEARIEAESLIYTSERAVEEYGGVVTVEDLDLIQADIAALKGAVKEDDVDLIREFRSQLETSAFRIAEAMYANVEPDSDGFEETVPPDGDDPEEDGGGPIEA
jgi:molecular chaperone DnaK